MINHHNAYLVDMFRCFIPMIKSLPYKFRWRNIHQFLRMGVERNNDISSLHSFLAVQYSFYLCHYTRFFVYKKVRILLVSKHFLTKTVILSIRSFMIVNTFLVLDRSLSLFLKICPNININFLEFHRFYRNFLMNFFLIKEKPVSKVISWRISLCDSVTEIDNHHAYGFQTSLFHPSNQFINNLCSDLNNQATIEG